MKAGLMLRIDVQRRPLFCSWSGFWCHKDVVKLITGDQNAVAVSGYRCTLQTWAPVKYFRRADGSIGLIIPGVTDGDGKLLPGMGEKLDRGESIP